MQETTLTPTSYIVLGLLEMIGPATPYQLKQRATTSVGNFWSVQHAQFYTEPERLTKAGLLSEDRERGGRRRKLYTLEKAGRQALESWRREPTSGLSELRDPGLLRLFFGAPPEPLAAAQLEAHRAHLAGYEQMRAEAAESVRPGARAALEAGIAHEREWVRFWEGVARGID